LELDNIGFYTLTNTRCKNASVTSQLMRCEIILTDACNFKCPYCRGLKDDLKGTIPFEKAKYIVDLFARDNLKNIRLSGGEPTVYKEIIPLVTYIKSKGIERIAMSTNGYADIELYYDLIEAGVNDFSISLDACCSAFGDMMAGGITGAWEKVISNIKELSKLTYVSVGCVVTEETASELGNTIKFAADLGVSDIRIISSAQYNTLLINAKNIDKYIAETHPILKYRIDNLNKDRNVRGLKSDDSHRCNLVLDDMAIAGDYHFPCIIYMREGGNPIGQIGENMRKERSDWAKSHDTHCDTICKKNCLDVCIDYNNKYIKYKTEKCDLPKLDSTEFTWNRWRSGSVHDLDIQCRYEELISVKSKIKIKEYAVGWAFSESLMCRPKEKAIAVMFYKDGEYFWFHLNQNEFYEIFC